MRDADLAGHVMNFVWDELDRVIDDAGAGEGVLDQLEIRARTVTVDVNTTVDCDVSEQFTVGEELRLLRNNGSRVDQLGDYHPVVGAENS